MKQTTQLSILTLSHGLVFGLGLVAYWLWIDGKRVNEPSTTLTGEGGQAGGQSSWREIGQAGSASQRSSVNGRRGRDSKVPDDGTVMETQAEPAYAHVSEIFSAGIPQDQLIDEVVNYIDQRMGVASRQEVSDEVLELPGGPARAYALLAVVEGAEVGEQAALINELLPRLDGLEYRSVASAIAAKWSDSDPKAAFEFGLGEKKGELRDFLLRIGASEMARVAPLDAAQTLERVSKDLGSAYPVMVNEVASTWTESDPAAATEWYGKVAKDWPSGMRDEGYYNLLTTQGQEDPQQALANLAVVESQQLRNDIQETVYRLWSESDPVAAGTHLSATDYAPKLESSVRTLALEWSDYDSQAAVSWLESWKSIDGGLKAELLLEIKDSH